MIRNGKRLGLINAANDTVAEKRTSRRLKYEYPHEPIKQRRTSMQ
jgi:hypothetical protein